MCAPCPCFLATYVYHTHACSSLTVNPFLLVRSKANWNTQAPSLFSSPTFFQQVGRWLGSISLPDYVSVFHHNHVSGNIVLKLDRESLKELVPSVGHRILLLEALASLVPSCGLPLGPPAAAAYLRKLHPHSQ